MNYYALKTDCYFRKYESIGHLIRPIIFKEIIVDEVGSMFLELISYEARNVEDITQKLKERFFDVSEDLLKEDIITFFDKLVTDGYIDSGNSIASFQHNGFSYNTLQGKIAQTDSHARLEEASSSFLDEYAKHHPFLETFHIELTSRCNERCVHCYIPHADKTRDIEKKLMYSVLKQCKDIGVLTTVFSGGEPTLHPNFKEFVRYAKDLDLNVVVLSNMTYLDDEMIEVLKYKHAACVNVSLYSMDSSIHDSITTIEGSFERTKENILSLINNNIAVQINCPVMKQNKDSFSEVISWGQEHKCSVVTDYLIMARYDHSVDNLDYRITKKDLKSVIRACMENDLVLRTNIAVTAEEELEKRANSDSRVCGVGMTTLCMISDGTVYPCAGWQKYKCGNLCEDLLKDIWENSPQVKYLRSLRLKDFKQCVNCEDYNYCLMCMSRNSNEDPEGDIFAIPPITCDAAKEHHTTVDEFKKSLLKNI